MPLRKLIAIISVSCIFALLTGCSSVLFPYSQLEKDYFFGDPDMAVIYGKIGNPPLGKEFYLALNTDYQKTKPLHGSSNHLFAISVEPGFYRLFLTKTNNPIFTSGQQSTFHNSDGPFDFNNGVDENNIRYRFKPGMIYYFGDIVWKNGYIQVTPNKDSADVEMKRYYVNFSGGAAQDLSNNENGK